MSETQIPTNDPIPNEGAQPGAVQDNQPDGQAEPKAEPEKKYGDWRDQRIARFERQRNEERQARTAAEERARDLEARVQAYERQQRGEQPQDNQRQQAPNIEAVRAQERERVATEAREMDFHQKCDSIAKRAISTFGDESFGQALTNWARAGLTDTLPNGQVQMTKEGRAMLEELVSFDHAAEMYHHIGTDPDLASHLLGLSDKERYAELRDIARNQPWTDGAQPAQESAPASVLRQVSQAPRPVGRQPGPARQSSKSIYTPDLSMDDFVALRSKKS